MGYPHGTVPTPPGVRVQPTPIYETVTMCLLAYALWKLRDRFRPGVVFALYLIGSGLERFLVEFIRRNSAVLAGLTSPQLESIAVFAIGLCWLGLLVGRGGMAALRPTSAECARDNPGDAYRNHPLPRVPARQPPERPRTPGDRGMRHRR